MSVLREIQHDLTRTFRRSGDGHYVDWATRLASAHRSEIVVLERSHAVWRLVWCACGLGFGYFLGALWPL